MSLPANCSIRAAAGSDIPAIFSLAENTPNAAHWSARQYQDIFNPVAPRRLALVIEEGDSVRGFIVGRSMAREWEIENIVVAPAYQQLGFGSRLLKEFLEIARKASASSVLLEVRESNFAARRLYQKTGFVQTAIRPRYYQEPSENALIYKVSID